MEALRVIVNGKVVSYKYDTHFVKTMRIMRGLMENRDVPSPRFMPTRSKKADVRMDKAVFWKLYQLIEEQAEAVKCRDYYEDYLRNRYYKEQPDWCTSYSLEQDIKQFSRQIECIYFDIEDLLR